MQLIDKNIDPKITVSIITVNYHARHLLFNAINSIFTHTKDLFFEIIVIDNNSDESLFKILDEKFDKQIKFISLANNIGFGKANNEGAKISKGEYLFFLNPDTILMSNAIKILADFLDSNPNAGACGGNLYSKDLKPVHSCMPVLPSIFLELDSLLAHIPFILKWGRRFDFNMSGKVQKVADIIGADLMVRSSLFNELGKFDPDFFMYLEETELAYRIQKSGYEIYSVPDAKIIHLEGKSTASDISRRKMALVSRKIYYKKTHNKFNRVIIDIIFFLKCCLLIIKSVIFFNADYIKYWIYALRKGMIELW